MPIFDWFDKLVTEHGSAAIQKTHIDLLRDQAKALEKENADLKKRVAELEELTRTLAGNLKAKAATEEYVRHRGVLFRKLPDGDYEECVYCPNCHGPMFSLQGILPFSCGKCKVTANFTGSELTTKILPEVKRIHG
jgi:hypothetical protein